MSFYHGALETISREDLESLQLERLKELVDRALKTDFYKEKLKQKGINSGSDIKSLKDIEKISFTSKNDLREAFPYGLLAVDKKDVCRLHASSGTTGIPTVIYHTKEDINTWTGLLSRSLAATGCSSDDVIQNMMTYGLFTGGLGVHYAAEELGMMVIPASSGNTKKQITMLKDFGATVVHATPSYLLHLYVKLEEAGIKPSDLKLKKALVGAEPHSEDVRLKIQELYGMDVYNSYGLSEMNGPGVAFECEEKNGMHLWEDSFLLEIIDPETGEVLPEGEEGELVLSTLTRQATPLLRYRTRDLTRIIPGSCSCGRTHRRLARIKGRSDDMLIINGVNVFPSQIEEVIMSLKEMGNNYQIIVQKAGALDKLIVKTEVTAEVFTDDTRDLEKLKKKIVENLSASIFIKPVIELHESGSLPVYEGKAVRVFDER